MEGWFELGYIGLFVASFLAATILPFSSEAMVLAMFIGGFDSSLILIFASIGNWMGGMTSYGLGYLGNWHWIESKLNVKQQKVERFKKWIDKYGVYTALMCWIPVFGDPLAIALGFFRTNVVIVASLMLVGKTLRYLIVYWLFIAVN